MTIVLKRPEEIAAMRESGRIVARALDAMREAVKPGISTWDLDQIVARIFQQHNARPAFLGYPPNSPHPFPATITASINHELIHGIPSKDRILQEGDIVSLDTACHYNGFVGDAAFTIGVGEISPQAQKLLEVTEEALWVGIRAAIQGHETSDVSAAIHRHVRSHDHHVILEYTGHGVGRAMHEEPSMPNWWPKNKRLQRRFRWHSYPLQAGMTFALEPMVSIGDPAVAELDDHWTVVTQDGSLCAHFEHTIAVVGDEPLVLTLP